MASSRAKAPLPLSPVQGTVLAVTFLGLALGGTTRIWEQGLVLLLAAGIILAAPPRRLPGSGPVILFPLLFLLSLAAFLPAGLASLPWRDHLVSEIHLTLPFTRTPQPWITLQSCLLLFAGLAWAGYVLSQPWTAERRLEMARILVFGVAVLALLAIAAFGLDFHVPTWDQEENRGWFPNRNQTADVLALCAVVNYALVFDCLRKKKSSLYLWLCTLAILDAALVVSYSRAGILLFFGGIVLWHLWPAPRSKGRSAAKWPAIGFTLVFILLTFFFVFGGGTFERIAGSETHFSSQDNRFRWAIQQDAFHFSLQSPWFGVGLGNFEPLFASARQASVNADRTIHPESDWLWAACELGWFAPLLFLAGLAWWLKKCLPFRLKQGESLRRALFVAGLLFVAHGFVDVSAHRIGSLFVGLLVFSLALPANEKTARERPAVAGFFRLAAAAMAVIALWWLASSIGAPLPPTTATLDRAEKRIDAAVAENRLADMEAAATEALRIAPINWHLYFQRAYAQTFQPGKLARASGDFMTARQLESKWVKPCFDEGVTWLAAGQPDLCLDAWQEALRRADPSDVLELYRDMSSRSHANDVVHSGLLDFAAGKIDYELIFLTEASPEETEKIVGEILARDPDLKTLDRERREKLFQAWWAQGDREKLVTNLVAHAGWMEAGWLFLAQSYADQKDFHDAWLTVARYAPPPAVPNVSSDRSLDDLQGTFSEQSDNMGRRHPPLPRPGEGGPDRGRPRHPAHPGKKQELPPLRLLPRGETLGRAAAVGAGLERLVDLPLGLVKEGMKILQVIHSVDPRAGGTTEGLRQFSAALVRRGTGVDVLTLDAPGAPWLADFPLPVFALGTGRPGYGYAPGVVPWLVEHAADYDLMVVNGLWQFAGFAVRRAALRTGRPYAVFPPRDARSLVQALLPAQASQEMALLPWGEYRVLRDAARVFFTSEEERLEARKSFWLYRCREEVLGFGIDAPPPGGGPPSFSGSFPSSRGNGSSSFSAGCTRRKAATSSCAPFTGSRRGRKALHLVMAGPYDSPYGAEMVRLARELDLPVTWTGMLSGDLKWSAFRAAEAFLLPSHQENFGVSVVEALASGCPVLISDKVNIWREISSDQAGLVENDDLPEPSACSNSGLPWKLLPGRAFGKKRRTASSITFVWTGWLVNSSPSLPITLSAGTTKSIRSPIKFLSKIETVGIITPH